MRLFIRFCLLLLTLYGCQRDLAAQAYSPHVRLRNQVDTTSLTALAQGIYLQAGAVTDRQKAEAIWRFFLTDNRYVAAPLFWYHIAGWAYEEPAGEVLDVLKLLNSYGFGLCYHIAPLLAAVYDAGGLEARVWFLTGHTVAEVYYDGAYHHYDSDMLGYTTIGDGEPKHQPVASVQQLAQDAKLILSKLKSPTEADPAKVDDPWYPADVKESAMEGLAELFTSVQDNWLYPYTRYSQGHSMEFTLRPGERLIRYFSPEADNLCYLPYASDGAQWQEFPQEIATYKIRTSDGPRSQKDNRRWATGRIEYHPDLWNPQAYYPLWEDSFNENLLLPVTHSPAGFLSPKEPGRTARVVFEMPSSYVLIDARLAVQARLQSKNHSLQVESSTDAGRSWQPWGVLKGPYQGKWEIPATVRLRSEHGVLTAVSGTYGYLLRLSLLGPAPTEALQISDITLISRFQLNPRTLPQLALGHNELVYEPGLVRQRRAIPVRLNQLQPFAHSVSNLRCATEHGQEALVPIDGKSGEVIFELSAPGGLDLSGFEAGGRFLDFSDGLAPDKLTAEVRDTSWKDLVSSKTSVRKASLAWSATPEGSFTTLWEYDPRLKWRDNQPVRQVLRWPEVNRQVQGLKPSLKRIYVRYRMEGMGLDSLRLAVFSPVTAGPSKLEITHQWRQQGEEKTRIERIDKPGSPRTYFVDVPQGGEVENLAVILACPSKRNSE